MNIDNLVKLKDYVPIFQTILWILFLIIILIIYKKYFEKILNCIIERIKKGSSFKAGPIEIGEDLKKLEYAEPSNQLSKNNDSEDERENYRKSIYQKNKGIFLSHIITPSSKKNQKYDIYIYLIRHKSNDFCDIEKAEFFFGHMWDNKIFTEKIKNGKIGISTSAYAPFLCICKIIFKDKSEIIIDRYIDFEIEKYIFSEHGV